jgi:hypothetical protein
MTKTIDRQNTGLIDKEVVLASIVEPMQRYQQKMTRTLSDWQPLEDAAALLLQGRDVSDDTLHPDFVPLVKMMRLIRDLSRAAAWDWAHPLVQQTFREVADGWIFTLFSNTVVDLLISIMKRVTVRTVVEAGTGPGKVTAQLCEEMVHNHLDDISLIISDKIPAISQTAAALRNKFPSLAITDFVWDVREEADPKLYDLLTPPVMGFERFCLPYAGHSAIDNIARCADILLVVDDLSITGKKASFDLLYEKIGTQFLIFDTAKKHLEKFFSLIYICDMAVVTAINSPVVTFTLAAR